MESKPDFPFILVSRKEPERSWNLDYLNAFLDEVVAEYRVDKDRVYLTGASMGGSGTWAFAASTLKNLPPSRPFPVPAILAMRKNLPGFRSRFFTVKEDPVVPLGKATTMVDAIKSAGGNIKLTIYPDGKHDAWTATYDNPELYTMVFGAEASQLINTAPTTCIFQIHHKSKKREK